MNRHLSYVLSWVLLLSLSGCANIKGASKSSTSLSSLLGLSELPDWYITSRYSYPDSNWIDNDFGLPIHYRELGEGPTVLLIHGEMSSLHTWEKWIEELSANFHIIAIDLPGSGLTGTTGCVDDTSKICASNLSEDYLRHTLEYFIDDLELRNISIIGSSYGAYLGARYTLDHPENVDKLILVTPQGMQQEIPSSMTYLTSAGTRLLSRFIQPSAVITNIIDDFYANRESIKRINLERYIHLAQSDGAHLSNIYQLDLVKNIMEHGTTAEFSKLEANTLVLWGGADKWGDSSHAERWDADIENSTLVKYDFLGHALMEEDPVTTVADVAAFLVDDPLPSIEGLGIGGSFSIQDALGDLDKEALFGTGETSENETTLEDEADIQDLDATVDDDIEEVDEVSDEP